MAELSLLAVATAVSAGASVVQGFQAARASRANADALRADAAARQQAAKLKEAQSRRRSAQILARGRSRFAAGGVRVNVGTPLDVRADSAAQGELDARIIRFGGDVEASRLRSQADQADAQAGQALLGGIAGAGTSLLLSDAEFFGPEKKTKVPTGGGRV